MENELIFKETQRFNQVWVWILLALINAPAFIIIIYQRYNGIPMGDIPVSNAELVISTITSLLIIVLFLVTRLETMINKDGIYVRFYPFQPNYMVFTWDKISTAFVRQYDPIAEYGGWGLRFGLFGRGKAFNISGNKGLQLVFHDGTKLLIGTQKPEELSEILKRIGK